MLELTVFSGCILLKTLYVTVFQVLPIRSFGNQMVKSVTSLQTNDRHTEKMDLHLSVCYFLKSPASAVLYTKATGPVNYGRLWYF